MTGQRKLPSRLPRSCIRNQSQEDLLKRTKIVLALPSNNRQRLSGIRRGWCPSQSQGIERVIRSDSGVAHRLSLSARVVSAADRQVKAKRQGKKRLWHLRNRPAQEFPGTPKARLWSAIPDNDPDAETTLVSAALITTGHLAAGLSIPRQRARSGARRTSCNLILPG